MRPNLRLLDEVYKVLDYESGDLVDIASYSKTVNIDNYISKGQWLDTCNTINQRAWFKVDKLFFVQNNPIVVFVDASAVDKEKIFSVFNEIWSLARPRLLFIENSTSITIYDLASNPAKSNNDLNPLSSIVNESRQILSKLKDFDRSRIESGTVFGDKRFATVNRRADHSLIYDLKQARKKLFENGLDGDKLKYAHALIGRSIFIRYLEDRGVLTKEYFLKVADGNFKWIKLIETPLDVNFYRDEMRDLIYPRLLSDKELTYLLFKQIAEDFNGDTFASDNLEEGFIKQAHLNLLKNFLLGEGNSPQLPLFLWAYRFDIIPIDLISSIYEEFYHSENLIDNKTKKLKDGKGTHYTPSSLVEFVLSRSLTKEMLTLKPRVLDPACGSGIFLVESFRRMVRHKIAVSGKDRLTVDELLAILKNQIAGIEINGEAIKIAAFSLYLSLLHYLNPPSILDYIQSGKKLPFLIYHGQNEENHFNILLESNSFNESKTSSIFRIGSFDAVVGNPPWGAPPLNDVNGRSELEVIENWCKNNGIEFPTKEPSMAFVFRALSYLKDGGITSLLVSSGILFKHSKASINCRKRLISEYTLEEIVNFAHVRHIFFSAISPFILATFRKIESSNNSINYISLRNTRRIDNNKVVLLEAKDFKQINAHQTVTDDVWKMFYWGNEYDFNLISSIRRLTPFKDFVKLSGRGFQESNRANPSDWLSKYEYLPTEKLKNKYSTVVENQLSQLLEPTPSYVEARGKEELYSGLRILIRRGIVQDIEPKGQIISRLEQQTFAFKNSVHAIKLYEEFDSLYDVIIGILWSSLYRYYMFMTASTWGTWMQEAHMTEILNFPIPNINDEQKKTFKSLIERIRDLNMLSSDRNLFDTRECGESLVELEDKLDELVFDAYKLTNFERQLIKDRCQYEIDYFYHKDKGLANHATDIDSLSKYIESFQRQWSRNLDKDEFFEPQIIYSGDKSMLGVLFHLRSHSNDYGNDIRIEEDLNDFKMLLSTELSRNIYTDGLLRRVSSDTIFIVKRNLKGHWTQTDAFADAEATLLQALSNE